jgi:outer membrane protein assembly factor BamA
LKVLKINDLKDKNNRIAKIKENTIFQPYLIKQDIKNISNYLKNIGYLNNKVNYQIIKIENNKINLFYKIDLKNKFKINRIFFIGNKYFKSQLLRCNFIQANMVGGNFYQAQLLLLNLY